MAEGMTYLAVAYLGMLAAIGLWTWTVLHVATTSKGLKLSSEVSKAC